MSTAVAPYPKFQPACSPALTIYIYSYVLLSLYCMSRYPNDRPKKKKMRAIVIWSNNFRRCLAECCFFTPQIHVHLIVLYLKMPPSVGASWRVWTTPLSPVSVQKDVDSVRGPGRATLSATRQRGDWVSLYIYVTYNFEYSILRL